MSLVKRIKGDLEFLSIDPNDNMEFTTKLFTINGDLTVLGTTTTVESTDTLITDNILTLNSGENGPDGITLGVSGIEIDRGPNYLNVRMQYNETSDGWEATDNGTDFYSLFTVTELFDDKTPQLGGDLDVNNFKITSEIDDHIVIETGGGAGLLKIHSPLTIIEQVSDPQSLTGYNKLYAKEAGSGDSGIFFMRNIPEGEFGEAVGDELVSKTKAMIFSLIF